MRRAETKGERLRMKTVYDLVDDWESGTLTEQDVAHLKTLMKERAVRAPPQQLRAAGGFLYELQPGARQRLRRRRLLAARGRPHGDRWLRAD